MRAVCHGGFDDVPKPSVASQEYARGGARYDGAAVRFARFSSILPAAALVGLSFATFGTARAHREPLHISLTPVESNVAAPLWAPCPPGTFPDGDACVHLPGDLRPSEDALSAENAHRERSGRWTVYEQIPRRPDCPASYDDYRYPVPPGLPGGHFVLSGYDPDRPDESQRRGRALHAVGHGGVDLPNPRGRPSRWSHSKIRWATRTSSTWAPSSERRSCIGAIPSAKGRGSATTCFSTAISGRARTRVGRRADGQGGRGPRLRGRHRLARARAPAPRSTSRQGWARFVVAREDEERGLAPRKRRHGRCDPRNVLPASRRLIGRGPTSREVALGHAYDLQRGALRACRRARLDEGGSRNRLTRRRVHEDRAALRLRGREVRPGARRARSPATGGSPCLVCMSLH